MMPVLRSIAKAFLFAIVGIVTVIVGAFMIRGTIHLWDKKDDKDKEP